MNSTASWPCAALYRAELAPRTTMRVGGVAEWLLEPANPNEFAEAWCAARERGFRPRILGGGANLLIADGLFEGVVMTTERMGRVFRPRHGEHTGAVALDDAAQGGEDAGAPFEPLLPPTEVLERDQDPRLVAWAGAGMPGLVRTARELGWSGLEGLVGVPGHLGGGVAMNAGGRWGELWDVVESVRVLTPEGQLEDRHRADCEPRYRDANLGGAIVLGAVLRLAVGNREAIQSTIRQYLSEKSAAQPVTERSCGCVFKNPDPELSEGRSAGQLIEACGAKGLQRGRAVVSPKHGNFIVNRGGASATDVYLLIEDVRRLVRERAGVELENEVKTWDDSRAESGTP